MLRIKGMSPHTAKAMIPIAGANCTAVGLASKVLHDL